MRSDAMPPADLLWYWQPALETGCGLVSSDYRFAPIFVAAARAGASTVGCTDYNLSERTAVLRPGSRVTWTQHCRSAGHRATVESPPGETARPLEACQHVVRKKPRVLDVQYCSATRVQYSRRNARVWTRSSLRKSTELSRRSRHPKLPKKAPPRVARGTYRQTVEFAGDIIETLRRRPRVAAGDESLKREALASTKPR